MAKIHFPFGKNSLEINVLDEYLGEVVLPKTIKPAQGVEQLIQESLDHPIGCPPLGKMIKPNQHVAIIVDDYTRMTPVHRFLPQILSELHSVGIQKSEIRIVFALGTHRPMTLAEIIAKVGAEIAGEYQLVNVPSSTLSEMVYMGESSNHIPVWVNRTVAEADFRIGLGEIAPHLDVGFSGGAKIILPGVCGTETVDTFHARIADISSNQLGVIDAPLRLALENFVCERIPLNFIMNVIVNLDDEIYRCVAGDCIAAHRAGIQFAQQAFGTPVRQKYPIVIANSYPHQNDLWQSEKGLYCGDMITADGGTLILVTHAAEGNSNYPLFPHYIGMNPEALKLDLDALKVDDLKLAANGILIGRMKKRVNIGLVSSGLTQTDADLMGVNYYSTLEDAINEAIQKLTPQARMGSIGILPQAGITLPIIRPNKLA